MKMGSEIHERNSRQKPEFLFISIIMLKNVYRLEGLLKGFVKIDRQKNIF